jgi:hypothetical protein
MVPVLLRIQRLAQAYYGYAPSGTCDVAVMISRGNPDLWIIPYRICNLTRPSQLGS